VPLLFSFALGRSAKVGEFQLGVTYQPKVYVDVNVLGVDMNMIQKSTVALMKLVWGLI